MRLLAIDTATERCSVALRLDGRVIERATEQPRGHADLVLPMVESVLQEAGLQLTELDGIAYGRGPGAFTGVRIAVGVVQGLAFGAGLKTVGVSNLAAVAQQVAQPSASSGERILVCMDARMEQVYWSCFAREPGSELVTPLAPERVDAPDAVADGDYTTLAGTGFAAYPHLRARLAVGSRAVHETVLPRARDIALLAEAEFLAGRAKPATDAEPVYVRDQVAHVKTRNSPPGGPASTLCHLPPTSAVPVTGL